ncbi:MAG: hypothetical protein WBF73_36750, partial [Bradyrhizobium sp.]
MSVHSCWRGGLTSAHPRGYRTMRKALLTLLGLFVVSRCTWAADIKQSSLYSRIKASLDAVPAIDTHDHLRPFGEISNTDETD